MTNNFITNSQQGVSLKNRLEKLMTASQELKFLVGFFYFSGWQEIYAQLQNNADIKLKILVGLQVDKHLSTIVEIGNTDDSLSQEEHFTQFIKSLGFAINNADMDNEEFFNQISFFVTMLEEGRLEIKKTLNPNHAKVYLFQYAQNYAELRNRKGEFITGSSNLTKAGLHGQEEFNVEISDYGFETAEKYFDDLWLTAIPITEAENGKPVIIDFLKNKTQAAYVTPFEAYVLILKTYIDNLQIEGDNEIIDKLLDDNGFEKYTYQKHAVHQSLDFIEKNNGVIIADVVGLGKSVIASLIANQLNQKTLILAPPGLVGNEKEGTGWWEYKYKFKLEKADIKSSGNVEAISESIQKNNINYEVIIVDEAHRFRNQDTSAYEALLQICRSKKVILLTATPFNNSPADIFSLLKLFVIPGLSSITLENDLEGKFNSYNYRFKNISTILKNCNSNEPDKREKANRLYEKTFGEKRPVNVSLVKNNVKSMANEIKEIISNVTIRRNRIDLKTDNDYKKEIANLSNLENPKELFYELSSEQSKFYTTIIKNYFSENGEFKGAIYKPFDYENKPKKDDKLNEEENRAKQQQRNLYDFMRRLLVKRFESSFGAFDKSIERFLRTNRMVLSFVEKSGKYVLDRKVIEDIYEDNPKKEDFILAEIEKTLLDFENNASNKTTPKHTKIYEVNKFVFKDDFINHIKSDIALFEKIHATIKELKLVDNDPKCKEVLAQINIALSRESNPKRKVIVFTEYTDTVTHLKKYLENEFSKRVLFCDGNITKNFALELDANFNARFKNSVDDYDVLITSDKLSEGFNLNRAGLIINYDIPWNPTRVIQRVGRINRMSAKVFDKLYIYNLFPTEQGADIVKSREIAEQKMFLIHNALGEDAKMFDIDEEPSASGLFNKINANPENDEELNIATVIRNEYAEIIENHPDVIKRISQFPNRTKTAKLYTEDNTVVLRKKGMALFSIVSKNINGKATIEEKTFPELIQFAKCPPEEERQNLTKEFWTSYELIKVFKPKNASGNSDLSLDTKSLISLRDLAKVKRDDIDLELISFINTLVTDIKKYKTLSKFTLRKLTLSDNKNIEPYGELIDNIKELRKKLGVDYLDIILKRADGIENDVIIAIQNKIVE